MKLSEIVGAATGLAIYAEVALVIFLAVFIAVVAQVLSNASRKEWKEAETLPLSDNCDDDVAPNTKTEDP